MCADHSRCECASDAVLEFHASLQTYLTNVSSGSDHIGRTVMLQLQIVVFSPHVRSVPCSSSVTSCVCATPQSFVQDMSPGMHRLGMHTGMQIYDSQM